MMTNIKLSRRLEWLAKLVERTVEEATPILILAFLAKMIEMTETIRHLIAEEEGGAT